jgi:hypothetical protein
MAGVDAEVLLGSPRVPTDNADMELFDVLRVPVLHGALPDAGDPVLALLASGLSFLRRSPSRFGQVFPAPSLPFNPFIFNLLSRRPEKVRRLLPPRDPKQFEVQKQKGSAGGNTFSTFPPSHFSSQSRPPRGTKAIKTIGPSRLSPLALFMRVIFLIHEGSLGPSSSPSLFHLTSLAIPCAKAP